ncbi:MAG: flavin reductase [Clostridia bacterium]|nr:flavin reductase [Clostridia bacterium]
MSEFHKVKPEELSDNVFRLIGKDWLLITARDPKSGKVNTMTASWGCLGILWNKPVAVCFIRPQRYTIEFVNAAERLSLSVLPDTYRDALRFCGTKSGRDCDKWRETGLTPVLDENETPYIGEARLALLCRKLFVGELHESGFLDPTLLENYKEKDYHTVFICEIESVLER